MPPRKKKQTTPTVVESKETALSNPMQGSGRGFDDFDEEDLIVPYMKIMQSLSPEVTEEEIAVAGDLLNSLSKHNYGKSTRFVPLMFRKRRIKWIDRDDGGGMDCGSMNAKIPDTGAIHAQRCAICPFAQWGKDEKGNTVPPACVKYLLFPSIVLGEKDQANKLIVMSFGATSFKAGQKLANLARMSGGDIFGRVYELKTNREKNDKGTYFVLQASPAGVVSKKEFAEAEAYYNMINSMNVEYHEEVQSSEPAEGDDLPF